MNRVLALALANVLIIGGGIARIATKGPDDNGEIKKSAEQIETDSQAAVARASTVRITADGVDDDGVKLSFDLTLVKDVGGRGRITEASQTVFVIKIKNDLYLNVSQPAASQTDVSKVTAGWLKVGPDVPGRSMIAGIFDLTSHLTDSADDTDTYTKSDRVTTVHGHRVITLTDTSDGSVGHVSATGAPVLLDIVDSSADGGTITFSDYGKKVTLSPPANFSTQGTTT